MKNLWVPNKFSTKVFRIFGLEIGNNTFVSYPKNIDMANISIGMEVLLVKIYIFIRMSMKEQVSQLEMMFLLLRMFSYI